MSDSPSVSLASPSKSSKSANNLATQIYAQLKADIFDFRLLPGDRFSEGDIAGRMQVSRTPVRQALFWLQREGYVDVHFRSGWQVREFDFKYFEDLYEVRVMMETSAIQKIVDGGLVSRLDPLRAIWAVKTEEREQQSTPMTSLDEGFHASLVAAVGNNEMVRIHDEVTERIRIIRRLDFTKMNRVDATYREHLQILDALYAGNARQAQSLICEHIAESQAEVKRITLYTLQTARERYASGEHA